MPSRARRRRPRRADARAGDRHARDAARGPRLVVAAGSTVGVLALQGDVREHAQLLKDLGVDAVAVKTTEDLEQVDALVIPGGESTTIGFMLAEHDMIEPLRKRIEDGMPVLGTCAGAILLARNDRRRRYRRRSGCSTRRASQCVRPPGRQLRGRRRGERCRDDARRASSGPP